jgi:hypothetical protein
MEIQMTSKHRSLQTSSTSLPTSNGDRDFEIEFNAPSLSSNDHVHTRPYVSFRANPNGNVGVRLQMELNDEEIFNQNLGTDASRNLVEIIDHGILRSQNNTLRVFVPNDEPGSITVSDVLVVYTAA